MKIIKKHTFRLSQSNHEMLISLAKKMGLTQNKLLNFILEVTHPISIQMQFNHRKNQEDK